jgi:hypothetical protein
MGEALIEIMVKRWNIADRRQIREIARLNAALDHAAFRVPVFQLTILRLQKHSGLLRGAMCRVLITVLGLVCSPGLEVVSILNDRRKCSS